MEKYHKVCSKCETPFVRYRRHGSICRLCRMDDQRRRRERNQNEDTQRYEKTLRGFLMRAYRNMLSRIRGVQKTKVHLYQGKSILTKDRFYTWASTNDTFLHLFVAWQKAGCPRRLTPSVDRIDSSKGYELSNMEWVPFYINCSRGAKKKVAE